MATDNTNETYTQLLEELYYLTKYKMKSIGDDIIGYDIQIQSVMSRLENILEHNNDEEDIVKRVVFEELRFLDQDKDDNIKDVLVDNIITNDNDIGEDEEDRDEIVSRYYIKIDEWIDEFYEE